MRFDLLAPADVRAQQPALAALLVACVDGGAALGFLRPLAPERAGAYVAGLAADVEAGRRLVLVARDGDALVGAVTVEFAKWEAGPHRAEVQKLMVDPRRRRQGVARELMERAEAAARERGRTLLILDTLVGTVADAMYRRWGWSEVGRIPSYAFDPDGRLATLVLFFKETGPHARR